MAMHWRTRRRCTGRGSSLSVTSCARAAQPSPGRSSTLSKVAWLTLSWETSGSGGEATSLSNTASSQATKPLGGLDLTSLRVRRASPATFFAACSLSITCSGACTTTRPDES